MVVAAVRRTAAVTVLAVIVGTMYLMSCANAGQGDRRVALAEIVSQPLRPQSAWYLKEMLSFVRKTI